MVQLQRTEYNDQELSQKFREMEEKYQEIRSRVETLQSANQTPSELDISKEFEFLKAENELKFQVLESKIDAEKVQRQLEDLQIEFAKVYMEKKALEESGIQMTSDSESQFYQMTLKKLEAKNGELQKTLAKKDSEISNLKEERLQDSDDYTVKEYRQIVENLDYEFQNLQKTSASEFEAMKKLKIENENLRKKIQKLETSTSESTKSEKNLIQMTLDFKDSGIAELTKELQIKEKEVVNLQNTVEKAQKTLKLNYSELTELGNKLQMQENDVKSLQNIAEEAQTTLAIKESEYEETLKMKDDEIQKLTFKLQKASLQKSLNPTEEVQRLQDDLDSETREFEKILEEKNQVISKLRVECHTTVMKKDDEILKLKTSILEMETPKTPKELQKMLESQNQILIKDMEIRTLKTELLRSRQEVERHQVRRQAIDSEDVDLHRVILNKENEIQKYKNALKKISQINQNQKKFGSSAPSDCELEFQQVLQMTLDAETEERRRNQEKVAVLEVELFERNQDVFKKGETIDQLCGYIVDLADSEEEEEGEDEEEEEDKWEE